MKNAIVIGGLSGVGKAIVQALRDQHFNVIVGDVKIDPSNKSDDLYFVDAVSIDSVSGFVSDVESKIEHLDVLVITIGVIDESSILNVSQDKWSWILNNNLFGSINLVDAFLPLLEKSNGSKLMLTGSGSGFGGIEVGSGLGLYAISKHALLGYYKVLRDELAEKGIQVSLLIPSSVVGNLAENSAQMRQNVFNEECSVNKGSPPQNRVLVDANVVASKFVTEFLNGKALITNNPSLLIEKCKSEYEALVKGLSL
jgi:NAD(P)-dependent dehydrogenase (short-subunit alcohol dehydrogenase family)